MALEDFFEQFIMQDWSSAPDGLGGLTWTLTDGAPFRAGISTVSTTEAKISEKNGMKTIYTIVTPETVVLEQNDRVRRVRDGRLYRITSDSADMTTPRVSDMRFAQVSAEVVEA